MRFPIEDVLPELGRALGQHASVVLTAPPGAGKSTHVPSYLAFEVFKNDPRTILVFEPRRLSVRTLAHFIAKRRGTKLGDEIGYQIRFENKTSERTRVKFITEGLFARLLLSDPYLEGIAAIVVDEFHERSLHADLALAQIQELQSTVRPDLKLVVMSATLDPAPLLKFLPDSVHVASDGRQHPVTVEFLDQALVAPREDARAATRTSGRAAPPWLDGIRRVLARIATEHSSDTRDVLVFLPGAPEINRVEEELTVEATRLGFRFYPLHGQLKIEEQERAIEPQGHRKAILATNIAETSITVENLGFVVDTGLAKVARLDFDFGVERLELERISQYSAEQRAGRAGRLGPGTAYRLWTRNEHQQLRRQVESEIHRVDLSPSLLQIYSQGASAETFPWFEAPRAENLEHARRKLEFLRAITAGVAPKITDVGKRLLEYPFDPRLARLFTLANDRVERSFAAFVSALLSEGDFLNFERSSVSRHHDESDLRDRLEILTGAREVPPGARLQRRKLENTRELVRRFDGELSDLRAWREGFDRMLLQAFPDRLCRLREGSKTDALMVGARGVRLFESSDAQGAPLFLALEARQLPGAQARVLGVALAHPLTERIVQEHGAAFLRRERKVFHDEEKGKLRAIQYRSFLDLPLQEGHPETPSPDELRAFIGDRFRADFVGELRAAPATRTLHARYELARKHAPDALAGHEPETWRDDFLNLLEHADLRSTEIDELLVQALPYPLQKFLETEVPARIDVPSGNRYAVEYRDELPPKLSVRLQEIFGWMASPRLVRGRVPLVLELLSPGFKPVQTTEDLKSFWDNLYFEVRGELKARYPKHSWPENPLEAKAVSKGRPRNAR